MYYCCSLRLVKCVIDEPEVVLSRQKGPENEPQRDSADDFVSIPGQFPFVENMPEEEDADDGRRNDAEIM